VRRVNNGCKGNVDLNEIPLNEEEKCTHLGSRVSKDGCSYSDIATRIGKARAAFICLSPFEGQNG